MFLWRQEDTSSLRLFSVDSSGRQMIRNFSLRQRLHLLLELLYGECDERMRQEIKCSMLFSLIGKISKNILDRINSTIAKKHNLNQWKNTTAVINWFKSIENKQQFSFICFDIEEFYPSISQDLLNKALDFASNYDNITTEERNIIIHAKNSILIHKHIPWQKKGNTTFDVTMGSYDGAETCELVGSFLLSQLQDLNINVGLYRDDGLAITNATPRDTENIKKEICRIFNNNGFRITIEANKQIINFLDVTFNLNRSTY